MKKKIKIAPLNGSLSFSLDAGDISFDNWQKHIDMASKMLYTLLQELLDNNLAQLINKDLSVFVPPEGIYYLLNEEEGSLFRQILDLPDYTDLKMLLESTGESYVFSDPSFRLSFRHFQSLEPFPVQSTKLIQNGIFWMKSNKLHSLIHQDEYNLLHDIENFNARGKSSTSETYRLYGKILESKKRCENIQFEKPLRGHDVVIPEKLELDLAQTGNDFELKANIVSNQNEILFQPLFDENFRKNKVKEIYTIPPEEGSTDRVHIPFTNKQKEQLEIIRKINNDQKAGKDIGDVISHPEKYFDLSEIDLSETFSERVIGLGEYQPQTRSFSSKIGNEWFPGVEIVDPVEGTKDIVFKKKEDLEDFNKLVENTVNEGKKTVPYQGYKIPIEDAQEIIKKAHEQFSTPQKATSPEKKILIIKENLNELEYIEEIQRPSMDNYRLRSIPNLAKNVLKNHQKEGIAWMQELHELREPGCLLADDMGLGKTLQVLCFIEWLSSLFENDKYAKVLIAAPKSLLENWKNEYMKFFPTGNYTPVILSADDKEYTRYLSIHAQQWEIPTLIITNYETLRFNQIEMAKISWDAVILDEAQKIKTPGTLTTNAAKALKTQFRVALTGTPVENTFQDIWCLMDFSLPGLMGSRKEFNNKYSETKNTADESIAEMGELIRKEIGPYILRRDKSILGNELLPKYISVQEDANSHFPIDCSSLIQIMPEKQKAAYDDIREEMSHAENRKMMIKMVGELKKISDHPDFATNFSELVKSSMDKGFWKDFATHSARLNGILPAIDKIKKQKEKVLIFAEYRFTQYILKMILQDRYTLKNIRIINGDSPVSITKKNGGTRQAIVDSFNESKGFNILILSPIAAGTGLTITGANHVIHYSRHWNPAKENQATDRAYRIGQKKPVYVYYPMAISNDYKTFDFILNDLLTRKNQLADSALFPSYKNNVSESDFINQFDKGRIDGG